MKKKVLLSILAFVFTITGCGKAGSTLSCHRDFVLFHSKQHIENKIYLDNNNKLVDYEYSESYFEFDSDNEYTRTCDGLKGEAENNTKIYNYLTQTAKCDSSKRIVTIYNKYDLSKVPSKNNLEGKNMRKYLDDKYVLDVENYKNEVIGKGYTCE